LIHGKEKVSYSDADAHAREIINTYGSWISVIIFIFGLIFSNFAIAAFVRGFSNLLLATVTAGYQFVQLFKRLIEPKSVKD